MAELVDLLLVIRLHRFRRQDARTDQGNGEDQQGHRGKLPVQVEHQPDAGDQLHERQHRAVGKMLDRAFIGGDVDGETRENFAALDPGKERRRQILHVVEHFCACIGDDAGRRACIPKLVPDRDDRGENARHRQHDQDAIKCLQILFVQRVVDQELQAQRHDDVEQGFDQKAEADDRNPLLVVLEERQRKTVDGRERPGSLARGEDDQILIVVIVVDVGRRAVRRRRRRRARPLPWPGWRPPPAWSRACLGPKRRGLRLGVRRSILVGRRFWRQRHTTGLPMEIDRRMTRTPAAAQ